MRLVRLLFLFLFLLVLAAGGFVLWLRQELHTPVAHSHANDYIEIPRGSSPDEIIGRLQQAGVIRRSWPLRLYLKVSGASARLKAGEYRFPSPISPLVVVRKLEEGQQRLARFTVIEGWTRWDIANAMAHLPDLNLADANEALALMNDTSLISDLDPTARNLEGYLYPDTYSFPPNTTPRQMIATMVQRFRQVWNGEMAEAARAQGRSVHEIVTVASLVETEAKLKDERPLMASVIYNRLQRGIPLGIDSTVIYASKLAGKWRNDGKVYQSDLDRSSPYNTRRARGLPPGPIASPHARSLSAALSPTPTNYLYYVREPSRDDGAHNFYSTDADFQRGVQALREWERQRDARAVSGNSNQ
jgi:UPF0755 protein